MRQYYTLLILLVVQILLLPVKEVNAQCMTYAVSLEERVSQSEAVALGEVTMQMSYEVLETGRIYTANVIEVKAWLKNAVPDDKVIVITDGGVVGDRAMIVHPSLKLQMQHDYVLFLEADNDSLSNPILRQTMPGIRQCRAYADGQGAIIKQFGLYRDIHAEPVRDEEGMFNRVQKLSNESAVTPGGKPFAPRPYVDNDLVWKSMPITGFSPTFTNAGTVDPDDFITIEGSGLGSPGNVFYANADNGGSNMVTSNVPSDYVSWSSTEIVAKVPDVAGTGTFTVQPASGPSSSSNSPLTVYYNHLSIYSEFQGFPEPTRQFVNLMNLNGDGGYDMFYNNNFDSNTAAKESFERALETWQCETGVNFVIAGTTPTNSSGSDGTNLIFFNSSLPPGVLGQTSTFYTGWWQTGCTQENTVWFLDEFDIAFRPSPGGGGWNFGPGATPSGQTDFESVALHELGHAVGLGHVIDPNAVMHWAIPGGTDQRDLTPSEVDGGLAKIAISEDICFIPPGTAGSMIQSFPGSCGFLPVDLLSFEARRKDRNTNILTWKVYEYDNHYFEVLRAKDGTDFEHIGKVYAQNLENVNQYEWEDRHTMGRSWYYRLRQVDIDGTQEELGIRYVQGGSDEEPRVWLAGDGHLKLEGLGGLEASSMSFQLFTIDGKILFDGPVEHGSNSLIINNLPTGLLPYRIINGQQVYAGKLVNVR